MNSIMNKLPDLSYRLEEDKMLLAVAWYGLRADIVQYMRIIIRDELKNETDKK